MKLKSVTRQLKFGVTVSDLESETKVSGKISKTSSRSLKYFRANFISDRKIFTYLFGSSWVQTDSAMLRSGLTASSETLKVQYPATSLLRPVLGHRFSIK